VDNEPYYPGQTITGRVECHFRTEKIIRSVQILFEGNGHVQFGTKNPIVKDEKYCNIQLDVTKNKGEIVQCPPGRYTYSFSFDLPYKLPASVTLDHGYVSYWVTAIVDLIGEKPLRYRKKVAVGSYLDLNTYAACKSPVNRTELKNMLIMLCRPPALIFDVKLPQAGYVPSQIVNLTAKVQNLSPVNVSAVRFKIVQVFKTVAQEYQQQQSKMLGKEQDAPNSDVASGSEKSWDVQLRIPPDTLAPDLTGCNIIKMHCEVIGTAVLPFPHRDLKIKVPFYLGTVPVKSTVTF